MYTQSGIFSDSLFHYIYLMKKALFSLILPLLLIITAYGQQDVKQIKTALLIIDIQDFYFPGDWPGLVNVEEASIQAGECLKTFRDEGQLVVHVRHKAKNGFDIHENVRPVEGEKVITKKEVNSYNNTDLLDYLKNNDVTRLVIIGMQTHMCLEAVVRASYDYGFECVVVEDACATRDLKFGDQIVKADNVHLSTLATLSSAQYAKVVDLKAFLEQKEMFLYEKLEIN